MVEDDRREDGSDVPLAPPHDPPTPGPSDVEPLEPAAQRATLRLIQQTVQEYWKGPLPPPERLTKYNDAFPGCAERIVAMAERQATHRQDQERRDQLFDFILESAGLVAGFLLAAGMIGGGVWLILQGKGVEGLIAIGTGVAAVLGAAWFARRKAAAAAEKKPTESTKPELVPSGVDSEASGKGSGTGPQNPGN